MEPTAYKFVVAGSGFLGSVVAERIANELKKPVLVVEKRNHTGGNCYSEKDAETGIELHRYGTHIFHTSNEKVWGYINRFTAFNQYRHQVLTTHRGKVYQMPINLETINSFYNLSLKPYEVDAFLQSEINKEQLSSTDNFENKAISLVGRKLYEALIRGYSKKQWQADPKVLPASLLSRLPFRKNYDENYYFSRYQGIPVNGYTAIFEKMLANPLITVMLKTDFFDIREQLSPDAMIIYSGPVDKYFNYCYGKMKWRSLRFEKQTVPYGDYQGTSVMNYADEDIPYTRIHEPRHLHCERNYPANQSVIITEYPVAASDTHEPFYPVPDRFNQALVQQYRALAATQTNLVIAGRLGDYKYYDMHETINQALEIFETRIKPAAV
jgi:UDP-galactopyranose mutase